MKSYGRTDEKHDLTKQVTNISIPTLPLFCLCVSLFLVGRNVSTEYYHILLHSFALRQEEMWRKTQGNNPFILTPSPGHLFAADE